MPKFHATNRLLRVSTLVVVVAIALQAALTGDALSFQGDCGQPSSSGTAPVASDALGILRAAVGTLPCVTCVCDVTADGKIAAADALQVLKFAVGSGGTLKCLECQTSAEIGPLGGVLRSADRLVKITVAAGAVASKKTFTVEGAPVTNLPAELRAGGASKAWRLGPSGQTFQKNVEVAVSRNGEALGGAGVIGAALSLLVTVSDGDVEFLSGQRMTVDDRIDFVTDGADLTHFSVLGAIPLNVTAKITGLPDDAGVGETHALKVRVQQDGAQAIVNTKGAFYTDDNFGVWAPKNGEINNVPLAKLGSEVFESTHNYTCTGAAPVNFTPHIRTVYDVTAPIPGAPTNVAHDTYPIGEILCAP